MSRDYARDYKEIPKYAKDFVGHTTMDFIHFYAQKRKIVEHRVGKDFWCLVDDGQIIVKYVDGIAYIANA